ncbi:hypothetical protein DERF_004644 [Dermatophagoides farinae]|nr:hypothetical protein DERF_004644 [Dermatophagoides farinae]
MQQNGIRITSKSQEPNISQIMQPSPYEQTLEPDSVGVIMNMSSSNDRSNSNSNSKKTTTTTTLSLSPNSAFQTPSTIQQQQSSKRLSRRSGAGIGCLHRTSLLPLSLQQLTHSFALAHHRSTSQMIQFKC